MKCNSSYLLIGHILLHINKVIGSKYNYPGLSCSITPISAEDNKVRCFSDPNDTFKFSPQRLTFVEDEMGPLSKMKELEIDLGKMNAFRASIKVILNLILNVKLIKLTVKSKLEISDFNKSTTTPQKKHSLLSSLSGMETLQHLTFDNCQFDDEYGWKLPSSLLQVSFANNLYTRFDLTNQSKLHYINFEGNNFKRIPKMSSPEPPIVELNFKRNKEFYVTAIEIAPLCKLETLEIRNPFDESTIQPTKICDCKILKEWGLRQSITITTSVGPLADIDCKETPSSNCSMYELVKAEELRNQCIHRFTLMKNEKDLFDLYKNHIYIGIGIIVVICALFILYGIKEFMMRKVDLDAELDYESYLEADDRAISSFELPIGEMRIVR